MLYQVTDMEILDNYKLRLKFKDGACKVYDAHILLDDPVFSPLKDEELFRKAYVDVGGYGIIWNDDIDLSSGELYAHGVDVKGE
ncbi:MAG: DUF2442 domain-containing protein [Clostridia bacterium]|nr:DUF2442 domain-containing protein [Clostridia bacterium]